MKFLKLFLLLFVFSNLAIQGFAQVKEGDKIHHVVVQLNSADTSVWTSVIGNIKNFQKIWPDKVEIEVVVHGKALGFLMKDKTHLGEDIEQLLKKGVQFNGCENTMRKYSITKDMFIQNVGTVPSGVAELILKQEAGWGYLKSGS